MFQVSVRYLNLCRGAHRKNKVTIFSHLSLLIISTSVLFCYHKNLHSIRSVFCVIAVFERFNVCKISVACKCA